jgi:integration host factor subunit alpha
LKKEKENKMTITKDLQAISKELTKLASQTEKLAAELGKFCVKTKHERRGRNPATGEDMMLEPRRVVTFNCSRRLRDRINGKQH